MLTQADLQLLFRLLTSKLSESDPTERSDFSIPLTEFSIFTEAKRLVEGELRYRFGDSSVPE